MKNLTKKEIIEETLKYYKTHKRAIDNNIGCTYLTNRGSMCAVGRCLIDPKKAVKENYGDVYDFCDYKGNFNLDSQLKPEYKGHNIRFWSALQNFHDDTYYWEEHKKGNKLTEHGEKEYKRLLMTYGQS